MKLVLVIDRDNDLGEKTGIESPVVGREKVLDAAVKLAISDPEDSDPNAMFAGIKLCDKIGAEVAVVCGDKNVGISSDLKIARQLDEIASTLKPESVLVVTDGSEDEFILPLIYSRFKVDGVQRVVVKQSRTIESTYFLIKKMMSEPKIARATLVPLGIILIFYSLSLMFYRPEIGFGAIILFLGLYFLAKAYGLERVLEAYGSAVKRSVVEGRLSSVFYVMSAIFLVVGLTLSLNSKSSLEFVATSIPWIILSAIFIIFARAIDAIAEGLNFKKYVSTFFLTSSSGIILWSTSNFLISAKIEEFLISIILSISIALIGIYYLRKFRIKPL
ncbi:MAG: DUF373 family protein [Archaeoglobaceae archaeon]|nr:DUF373 family protein [Archaeoglobaceae archaeon]MCX8152318.1 DUF373 family protein [Archaeoglobaceae archaeon]MDW8013654.1 DUF373 family protein [Archaeoglobaceae archaeon]